jgi:hypothetical protein
MNRALTKLKIQRSDAQSYIFIEQVMAIQEEAPYMRNACLSINAIVIKAPLYIKRTDTGTIQAISLALAIDIEHRLT